MNISETLISPTELKPVREWVVRMASPLGIPLAGRSTAELVGAVEQAVSQWQQGRPPKAAEVKPEDLHIVLGTIWGEQLIAQFDWLWVNLTFHDFNDWSSLAVVSPDRALMILPYAYVCLCRDDQNVAVNMLAAFNAIGHQTLPAAAPGSYSNVMDTLAN